MLTLLSRQTDGGGAGILQMTRSSRRHGALQPMAALYAPQSCRSSAPYTDVHGHRALDYLAASDAEHKL
jgi:hypothetical protein